MTNLAVGSTESLSAHTRSVSPAERGRKIEIVKARGLMTLIPGSRMADDVATRFEVPIFFPYAALRRVI